MGNRKYILERWDWGWLICGNDSHGIPTKALSEVSSIFPENVIMDNGIVQHFKSKGKDNVVFAVATPEDAKKWREEITESLKGEPIFSQWWHGVNVGRSSASILYALMPKSSQFNYIELSARDLSREATPQDSGAFEKCEKLIEMMKWKDRLQEVAEAYPKTKWPEIIKRWDEISQAEKKIQSEILEEINHP